MQFIYTFNTEKYNWIELTKMGTKMNQKKFLAAKCTQNLSKLKNFSQNVKPWEPNRASLSADVLTFDSLLIVIIYTTGHARSMGAS